MRLQGRLGLLLGRSRKLLLSFQPPLTGEFFSRLDVRATESWRTIGTDSHYCDTSKTRRDEQRHGSISPLSLFIKLTNNGVKFEFSRRFQACKASSAWRLLGAINSMLVDMMAAIARKDYEQRREQQTQDISKAIALGKHQGRPGNTDVHKRGDRTTRSGLGIRAVVWHADCSSTTVLKIWDLAKD